MSIFDTFTNKDKQAIPYSESYTSSVRRVDGTKFDKTSGKSQEGSGVISSEFPKYRMLHNRWKLDPRIRGMTESYVRLALRSFPKKVDVFGIHGEPEKEAQEHLNELIKKSAIRKQWPKFAVRQNVIFGGSFFEHLKGKSTGHIKEFGIRTPFRMDFMKEKTTNLPALNKFGDFIGFEWDQGLPTTMQPYDNYSDMTYFRVGQADVGIPGSGIVECLLNDLAISEYIRQGYGKSALRVLRPVIKVKYKTLDGKVIRGMKKLADKVARDLAKFFSEDAVTSRYVTIPDFIEEATTDWGSPVPEGYMDYLNYTNKMIMMAYGFIIDTEGNQKVSTDQMDIYYSSFLGFLDEIGLEEFFQNILIQNGFSNEVDVRFKWNQVSSRFMKEETMRLQRLIKVMPTLGDDPNVQKQLIEQEGIYLARPIDAIDQL